MNWNHCQLSNPPPQKSVMVLVKTADGESLHTRAMWVNQFTVPAIHEGSDTTRDKKGQLWCVGGWYEDTLYCGQQRLPEGDRVTHWMPFPGPPPPIYGVDYLQ